MLRRRRFLTGAAAADLTWWTPAGLPMTDADWADTSARSVALLLDGMTDPDIAADGTPLVDDDFLLLVNAWWEPLTFTLPASSTERPWQVVIATYSDQPGGEPEDGPLAVGPRSVTVLQA